MNTHELAKALLELPCCEELTVSTNMSLGIDIDPNELTHGNRVFSDDICELIHIPNGNDEVVIVMGCAHPNFEFVVTKNADD